MYGSVFVLPSDVPTVLAAIDSEVSPCDASPCMNGGACLASERDPSQYICRCVADFGGRNCEKSKKNFTHILVCQLTCDQNFSMQLLLSEDISYLIFI